MHNNNEIRKRNPKFFIATTAIITAVMLLGTTAISTLTTAESVFAYRNNQATSQVSDCGNILSSQNVECRRFPLCKLDKTASVHDDVYDTFRLSLNLWH
jgi:hypothetical protein